MIDFKNPDWSTILEMSKINPTIHAILKAFPDESKVDLLTKMVYHLVLQNQETQSRLIEKCIAEPAVMMVKTPDVPKLVHCLEMIVSLLKDSNPHTSTLTWSDHLTRVAEIKDFIVNHLGD